MPRVVKVAVIGSGLAGLTAAYLLSEKQVVEEEVEFEVHLFEKVRFSESLRTRLSMFFSLEGRHAGHGCLFHLFAQSKQQK